MSDNTHAQRAAVADLSLRISWVSATSGECFGEKHLECGVEGHSQLSREVLDCRSDRWCQANRCGALCHTDDGTPNTFDGRVTTCKTHPQGTPMGSAIGVQKGWAARLGLSYEEYVARISAGQKWCLGCKDWHHRSAFGRDRSRRDGLASRCAEVRVVATTRPGVRERRSKAAHGLAWCRTCRDWLPSADVTQGACRPHLNAEARQFYAVKGPEITRRKVARARGLAPTPEWWREERFRQFGGLCAYGCGRLATALDHVFPVARGGQSRPDNLVPACKSCNSSKKDSDPAPWLERMFAAFPLELTDLIALNYERGGQLQEVN